MKCPKCNSDMEKVIHSAVEVDRCLGCGGLWFDALEADKLREVPGAQAIDSGDADTGRQYNRVEDIQCPSCHVAMLRMVDAAQPHIWYEACPTCYGVYFDAGEFTDYREASFADFFRDLFARERK